MMPDPFRRLGIHEVLRGGLADRLGAGRVPEQGAVASRLLIGKSELGDWPENQRILTVIDEEVGLLDRADEHLGMLLQVLVDRGGPRLARADDEEVR